MLKHPDITKERLGNFVNKLRGKVYSAHAPVAVSVFHAPGRITFQEAMAGTYEPTAVGQKVGPLWSTHWFKVEYEIPEKWNGCQVHLIWDSTSEACVWSPEGVPQQGLTGSAGRAAHDDDRPIRQEYVLAKSAEGGLTGTLYVEVACNHLFGVGGLTEVLDLTGMLRRAELAVFEQDAWDLLWDVAIIAEMAQLLPAETPRGGQALYVANQLCNVIDLADPATWPAGRELAAGFLSQTNGPSAHQLSAVGHAHIDSAWLWPRAETKRKCYRTFATAIRYMDDYPEYRFTWSQACQYEWMQKEHPAFWEKLKAKIDSGALVPTGGSWVEPDCNIPSGEALVRQFVMGQGYFQKELGIRCKVFWNPDVFGYSGQLPQIMKGAGIDYFLTQKLSWNQFNKLPSHTFFWEGIDGSRVLTHFPPADTYNGVATVKEVLFNVKNFKDLDRANESYLLYGYGDGGGGPSREMLERIRRMSDTEGLPRVTNRPPEVFFERCAADIKDPLVWVGELYFELHRGTYTTQAKNKRYNRKCEIALHDAEFLAALAAARNGAAYPAESLAEAWKLVLFNQFHDILPGSSINQVYVDSTEDYEQVLAAAGEAGKAAAAALVAPTDGAERVAVFNTLGRGRLEVVSLPEGVKGGQTAADGTALGVVEAPSLGYAVQQPETVVETPVSLTETGDGVVIENGFLTATFTADGILRSLVHKGSGRESIAPGEAGNQFVVYEDTPNRWDAWDMDIYHLEVRRSTPVATAMEVVESGPLRAAVKFQVPVSDHSSIAVTVRLDALSPWIEFDCDATWHERQKFLKVEFPVAVRAPQATYEIQFGHLQRPTHFNTSWDWARFEVCGHRWADLAEPDFGVALINDCKYGYATHGNVMRLSLLRAPLTPDPEADQGDHTFRYALMPHQGTFQQAGVIKAAARFNMPLHLAPTAAEPASFSAFSVDKPAVYLDTVKCSEDGKSLVVRFYEAYGTRGTARISSPLPVKSVARCNLLEEPEGQLAWQDGGVDVAFTPFQVVTLRLDLA